MLKYWLDSNWKAFNPVIRKRTWHDQYSLTIDGTNGKIEEFRFDGKNPEQDLHSEELAVLLDGVAEFAELISFSSGERLKIPEKPGLHLSNINQKTRQTIRYSKRSSAYS